MGTGAPRNTHKIGTQCECEYGYKNYEFWITTQNRVFGLWVRSSGIFWCDHFDFCAGKNIYLCTNLLNNFTLQAWSGQTVHELMSVAIKVEHLLFMSNVIKYFRVKIVF